MNIDTSRDSRISVNASGKFRFEDHWTANKDATHYEAVPYHILDRIFKVIHFTPDSQLVDLGCGKGRVVCFASRFRFKNILGVEIVPELVRIAEINAKKVRSKKSQIEIIRADVADFNCENADIFFFFNPFGEETMKSVLQNIQRSLKKQPRRLQLIYYNPICSELMDQCEWLEKKDPMGLHRKEGSPFKAYVEFYENKGTAF